MRGSRWSRRGLGAAALGLPAALLGGAGAQEDSAVDLELVLAIDASGSVDQSEFALQLHGIAGAFRDPEVHGAIAATGGRGIAVAFVQWSGRRQQVAVVEWTRVRDAAAAEAFAAAIEAGGRWLVGETAIADAIDFARDLLLVGRYRGIRQVIDVSGDGPTNAGRDPDAARDEAVALGMTINGLAITNEISDLDLYFRDHVIGGPGAFLMTARDYGDFAEAMRQKLIREIRGAPLAAGGHGSRRPGAQG